MCRVRSLCSRSRLRPLIGSNAGAAPAVSKHPFPARLAAEHAPLKVGLMAGAEPLQFFLIFRPIRASSDVSG